MQLCDTFKAALRQKFIVLNSSVKERNNLKSKAKFSSQESIKWGGK